MPGAPTPPLCSLVASGNDRALLACGHDHRAARLDGLVAKAEHVDRAGMRPVGDELLVGAIEDGAGWANRGTHRRQPSGAAVVAQVALVLEHLHQVELRHAEGAGVDAVATSDASLP